MVGGHLHLRILSRAEPSAVFQTLRGRFEVRLAPEDRGRVMVYWRDAERFVTSLRWLKPDPGDLVGPLELVARPYATLFVRVEDAHGVVVPGASVATQGRAPMARETFPLDEQGGLTLRVPPRPVHLSASGPSGRFRASRSVQLAPGAQQTVHLVLSGPWEPIAVRCRTQPAGQLTGETARVWIAVGDVRTSAEVVVDGGEQLVMLPPPSDEVVTLGASVGKRARLHRMESSWRRLRASLSLRALDLVLPCLGTVDLTLQTPGGGALGPFEVLVHNHIYWTDERGRVSLKGLPYGRHALRSGGREIGTVNVDSPTQVRSVAVSGLAEVGGAYSGPAQVGVVPFSVEVRAGPGRPLRGFVNAEAGRWHAWLPASVGTPIEASVRQNLRTFSEVASGVAGQRDLDLVVHATSLEVIPRLGAVRFPRGEVRLRGIDVDLGWSAQMNPQSDSVTFAPIPPGTYELDWSTDAGKTWSSATKQVVVGETPLRVEVDFSAPR